MNANYAEICRVNNMKADFQQVTLGHFFWKFHNIVAKHQQFKICKNKKGQNIFFDKTSKTSLYYCKGQTNFWPLIYF